MEKLNTLKLLLSKDDSIFLGERFLKVIPGFQSEIMQAVLSDNTV